MSPARSDVLVDVIRDGERRLHARGRRDDDRREAQQLLAHVLDHPGPQSPQRPEHLSARVGLALVQRLGRGVPLGPRLLAVAVFLDPDPLGEPHRRERPHEVDDRRLIVPLLVAVARRADHRGIGGERGVREGLQLGDVGERRDGRVHVDAELADVIDEGRRVAPERRRRRPPISSAAVRTSAIAASATKEAKAIRARSLRRADPGSARWRNRRACGCCPSCSRGSRDTDSRPPPRTRG